MKVYLVFVGYEYEGEEVKAVVASREEAEIVEKRYQAEIESLGFRDTRYVSIDEWTVGDIL